MKKLTFALACIIGMMFFASCTQEQIDEVMAQKPTVEFMSDEGLTSGDRIAAAGLTILTEGRRVTLYSETAPQGADPVAAASEASADKN